MPERPWPSDDELDANDYMEVGVMPDEEGEEHAFEIPVSPESAPEVCNILVNVLMQMGFEVEPAFKDHGRLLILLLQCTREYEYAADDDIPAP